jgi:hypothetical protein
MFLPDHLMTVFGQAQLVSVNNIQDFTPGSETLLTGSPLPKAAFRNAPLWVFLLVLLASVILSYRDLKDGRLSWWFDRILFGLTGLLGMLISFLWLGTDHQVTVWNLNIIWAHPFHLVIIFFFSLKSYPKLLKYYALVNLAVLVILILAWPFLPQPLPWIVTPFVFALAIRSAVIFRFSRSANLRLGQERY